MARKEVLRLLIVLGVTVVMWMVYLVLFRPVAQTTGLQRNWASVITRPAIFAICLIVAAYWQRRHESRFWLKLRRQYAWQAVVGSIIWVCLQASAQLYWHRTLTWAPVWGGLAWLVTTIAAGWLLLRITHRTTHDRRER